jgi:hypothetical protein
MIAHQTHARITVLVLMELAISPAAALPGLQVLSVTNLTRPSLMVPLATTGTKTP